MADAVFPYPGGKSRFASWILEQVPEHVCFVEVFGGATGVVANNEPETSDIERQTERSGTNSSEPTSRNHVSIRSQTANNSQH